MQTDPGVQLTTSPHYHEQTFVVKEKPLDIAINLVATELSDNYAVYEHNGEWSIGIGCFATVTLFQNRAVLCHNGQQQVWNNVDIISNITDTLAAIPVENWRAYGISKVELAHEFHDPD